MAKRGFDTGKFSIPEKTQHQGSTGGANVTTDYTFGSKGSGKTKAKSDGGYKTS